MFASLYLAPGPVSDGGNCERGCGPNIMSPDCPTHGFPVTRTRLRLTGTPTWLTGELSLYDGTRMLRWVAAGCPGADKPSALLSPESVELVDVESGKAIALT